MPESEILLIDPPGIAAGVHGDFPNVGLAYLAASLGAKNFTCRLLDLRQKNDPAQTLIAEIQRIRPRLSAFSIKSASWQ